MHNGTCLYLRRQFCHRSAMQAGHTCGRHSQGGPLSLAHRASGCSPCADWFEVEGGKDWTRHEGGCLGSSPPEDSGRSNAFTERASYAGSPRERWLTDLCGAQLLSQWTEKSGAGQSSCARREATLDGPKHLFWTRCLSTRPFCHLWKKLDHGGARGWKMEQPPFLTEHLFADVSCKQRWWVAMGVACRMGSCAMRWRGHPGGFVRHAPRVHSEQHSAASCGRGAWHCPWPCSLSGSAPTTMTSASAHARGKRCAWRRTAHQRICGKHRSGGSRTKADLQFCRSRNPLAPPHTARVWNTRLWETSGPTSAQKPSKPREEHFRHGEVDGPLRALGR